MPTQFNLTPGEEQHLHYFDCINSFNDAWRILQELQTASDKTAIHAAAYRYALVVYMRPYTGSNGEHKKRKNAYQLTVPFTGEELKLHKEIKVLRDKVLAHSDLDIQKADILVQRFSDNQLTTVFSRWRADFPDIEKVINLVERSIDHVSSLYEQSEAALAPPA